jgi:CheY-like chemotaxis protein
MKIVVIEDSPWNYSTRALSGLEGHELTVLTGMAKGCKFLQSQAPFDAALLDLWMPYEFDNGVNTFSTAHAEDGHWEGLIPAGNVFALVAALRGISVAVCTDGDHHSDPTVELMDLLPTDGRGGKIIKVEARNAHLTEEGRSIYYAPEVQRFVYFTFEGRRKVYFDADTHEVIEVVPGPNRIVKDWGAVLESLMFRG